MAQIEVTYYVKETGDIPVKEFIDSLDVKMAAKVRRTIALFRDNGSETMAVNCVRHTLSI